MCKMISIRGGLLRWEHSKTKTFQYHQQIKAPQLLLWHHWHLGEQFPSTAKTPLGNEANLPLSHPPAAPTGTNCCPKGWNKHRHKSWEGVTAKPHPPPCTSSHFQHSAKPLYHKSPHLNPKWMSHVQIPKFWKHSWTGWNAGRAGPAPQCSGQA